jgi:hypothetical protein
MASKGFLQSDASSVCDILERGPPIDEDGDDAIKLVGRMLSALPPPLARGRQPQVSS